MLCAGTSSSKAEAEASEREAVEATPTAPRKDPDRFYCPYPGCNRSFAELWRLKVHYRAAPDVRGSGKERGHGAELESCPKCGAELKPGRHHVGCAAGKQAAAQQEKRRSLKGRRRPNCKETPPPAATSANDPSMMDGVPGQPSTAWGVPVSWLPLDFDQFFQPMDRQHVDAGHVQMVPEQDSVYSWVYGQHGELPIMAMAQVGDDTDSDLDLLKYFNEASQLDASVHHGLQTVKEEFPTQTLTGDLMPLDVQQYSDGLDQFLSRIPDDIEEELTDITGKKRERRSSLEQRTEQRNGKEQNRRGSILRRDQPLKQIKSEIKAEGEKDVGRNVMSHYLRETVEVAAFDPGIATANLPTEVPVDLDLLGDSILPYSVERGAQIGMLVQDMVGFDIHRNEGTSNGHKTEEKPAT